jgi:hypothetical protein
MLYSNTADATVALLEAQTPIVWPFYCIGKGRELCQNYLTGNRYI